MRLLLALVLAVPFALAEKPGEAARKAEANQPAEYRKMMREAHKHAPKPYRTPNLKNPPKPKKQTPAQWGVKK